MSKLNNTTLTELVPPDEEEHRSAAHTASRGERPLLAYTHLRDLIVSGRLAPGSPLVVTDIAERLGVSRTPIHAALLRLHQEGLIVEADEARVFKYAIAPLTRSDAQSLFDVMGELEGLAALYAARRSADDRASLTETLTEINGQLRALAQANDPPPDCFFELDRQFHETICTMGGNPRLLGLLATISLQVERYWRAYAHRRIDVVNTSASEHDAISDAIARGDADAAQTAIRTNWRNSAARLLPAIDEIGEQGSW